MTRDAAEGTRRRTGLLLTLVLAITAWTATAWTMDPAGRPVATRQPPAPTAAPPALQPLDVIYVPTPHAVVTRMLELAAVGPKDVVYDLGSGDGRIVISAVRDFKAARAVGIELDPRRIAEANELARAAAVTDRVTFKQEDLFAADFSDATVITMYLLPTMNQRLLPKLRAMPRGTRIVSHNYDFGPAWPPNRREVVANELVLYWRR